MDKKSPKNLFQMNQKLFKDMFDSTAIISDHSDHVIAKVERDEPVQAIKMVIWLNNTTHDGVDHYDDLNGFTPVHFCF